MSWLAVDKDGKGYIYESKPIRVIDKWIIPYGGECSYFSGYILLPKSSAKKLIGKELTWNDEPVELKEE